MVFDQEMIVAQEPAALGREIDEERDQRAQDGRVRPPGSNRCP